MTKFLLNDDQIPQAWVNVLPYLKQPLDPPLDPRTRQPIGPEALQPIFPMALIEQEFSPKPEIEIPGEVLDIYKLWRPTPLYRARRLEKALDTPARIYYKYEGASPAGSHKPNTAVAQAYYNKKAGIRRLATETGAGQWGSALALACRMFDLECTVYMVKVSYRAETLPPHDDEHLGRYVYPSPSPHTESGRQVLAARSGFARQPGHRDQRSGRGRRDARRHELLARQRAEPRAPPPDRDRPGGQAADGAGWGEPDVVIGCFGGGSNFGGIALPYVLDELKGARVRLVADRAVGMSQPDQGRYAYDFGDTAKLTPLLKCTRSDTISFHPVSTQAACAITALPRCSAIS